MLRRQRLPAVVGGEEILRAVQLGEGQIGRVIGRCMHRHELRLRAHSRLGQDRLHRHAGEDVVVAAPAGDAVDVAHRLLPGEPLEVRPPERERPLHQPAHLEPPLGGIDHGYVTVVEHGPLPGHDLPGEKPVGPRGGDDSRGRAGIVGVVHARSTPGRFRRFHGPFERGGGA